jgi:dephospho-CoA kinase
MPGAGKSYVADYFKQAGYEYIRFGQATIDEIKKRGLPINEQNERDVRKELRNIHGMAAYAIINLDKIEKANNNVIIDGLYSWSEYKILKEKFKEHFFVLAVYAPPELRYDRLTHRADLFKNRVGGISRSRPLTSPYE